MKTTIAAVRPPKQQRSQQTLERLLDAAEEVVREEGLPGLTVTNVVRKARVSIGAFYRRFPDRDAMVYALQQRNHARALEVYQRQLDTLDVENVPLEDTLETLLSFRAAMVLKDAPLMHAFAVQGAISPAFQDEGRSFIAGCRVALSQVILAHRDEIRTRTPTWQKR